MLGLGMNNRDPFNLRNSSPALQLLRSSANTVQQRALQASQKIVAAVQAPDDIGLSKKQQDIDSSVEDASAETMSYTLPQNGPTHRHGDNWSRAGEGGKSDSGIGEKMSSMFNTDRRDSLPMYKDKPTGYFGNSRRLPWFKRKRNVAIALGSMAGLSWWFGILSPLSYFSSAGETSAAKSSGSWGLMTGKGSKVDWDDRANSVRDAFKISWEGYEKYAWGMFYLARVWLLHHKWRELQTDDRQASMNSNRKTKATG